MQHFRYKNNKGEFFCETAPASADAAFRHFSMNRCSGKVKADESFVNSFKPLKRRGLMRPAGGLRRAKEAAAAGPAWLTKAVFRISWAEN
jgi:hypothetical protein